MSAGPRLDYPNYIDGKWMTSETTFSVVSPYHGKKCALQFLANAEQIEQAAQVADCSFHLMKKSSRYSRQRFLHRISQKLNDYRDSLATCIVEEAGKPISLATIEVQRAVSTFRTAAEECLRFGGELTPVDWEASTQENYQQLAQVLWVPRGPVLAITPFNFPLNLMAHKVAPALASGCSVIIKPPPQAPGAAYWLARIVEEVIKEQPSEFEFAISSVQTVNASNNLLAPLLQDDRLRTLSFTGSDRVGFSLQQQSLHKQVVLELGGNAAVIVHQDANLKRAANRCAYGAYAYAGQICISVQRIFVHKNCYQDFLALFQEEIARLNVGNPMLSTTTVGPMIDGHNVQRILSWIEEAKTAGAEIVTGGNLTSQCPNILSPTLVSGNGQQRHTRLWAEEAFAPVCVMEPYENLQEAIIAVNDSRFGLQAGLFTDSQQAIYQASRELEVGGLLINDIPTFRADHLPYGGFKHSGLGREGIKSALQHYCEQKVIIHWN